MNVLKPPCAGIFKMCPGSHPPCRLEPAIVSKIGLRFAAEAGSSAGKLNYFDGLTHSPSTEVGPKDVFEAASTVRNDIGSGNPEKQTP